MEYVQVNKLGMACRSAMIIVFLLICPWLVEAASDESYMDLTSALLSIAITCLVLVIYKKGSSENMSSIKDEFFKIQRNLEVEFRLLPNASESKTSIVLKGTFSGKKIAMRKISMEHKMRADRELQVLQVTQHLSCTMTSLLHFNLLDDTIILMHNYEFNLEQFLEKECKNITEFTENEVVFQICNGLSELHKLKIVHGNLRPSSILMEVRNGVHRAVLSNFRKSQVGQEFTKIFRGDLHWASPEVEKDIPSKFSAKSDIFSLGLLAYFVWSYVEKLDGKVGFVKPIDTEILKSNLIFLHKYKAADVLVKMLCPEPHARISAEEVIKHPTFWKIGSIPFYFQCLKSSMTRKPFDLNCKKTFKWVEKVEKKAPALMQEMKQVAYYTDSHEDFTRFIRNLHVHFKDIQAARKIFGENQQKLEPWIEEHFLDLFLDIFNNSLTLVDNRFNEEFYLGNLLC